MSHSLPPHALWPTRLLCPWDSAGRNTGVGCHASHRGSSRPRDRTCVSCVSYIGRRVLYLQHHLGSPATHTQMHPFIDTSGLFSFPPALAVHAAACGECSKDAGECTCDSWTSGPADDMALHHSWFRCMVFPCGDRILPPRS